MTKKIIVAPLNWGLGHASRCVPIIHFLVRNNLTPIIASDGTSLKFLQQEFPLLERLELPSYNISYAKNLKWSLLKQTPTILRAIKKEKRVVEAFINKNKEVVGIISDNRFGIRSTKIPSIYITHQINVFSGLTTFFSTWIHQRLIKKFDECWIPDSKNSAFSGALSKVKKTKIKYRFIGVLSRLNKEKLAFKNDILILLSGEKNQRERLKNRLLYLFSNYSGKVVLVEGKVEGKQKTSTQNQIKIYNYLLSSDLEKEINQSEIVICRSGYSSIMDLAILGKKAFFIPTPNQSEQEYLAKHLKKQNLAPFSTEKTFNLLKLQEVNNYKGLYSETHILNKELLRLF